MHTRNFFRFRSKNMYTAHSSVAPVHNTKAYEGAEVQFHSKTRQWVEVTGHVKL